MVGCNIPLMSAICILGLYPTDLIRKKKQSEMTDFGLLHAKRVIDYTILEKCQTPITGNMEEGGDDFSWTGKIDIHC